MKKKYKKIIWLSGLVLVVVIGLLSMVLSKNNLLSAKQENTSMISSEQRYENPTNLMNDDKNILGIKAPDKVTSNEEMSRFAESNILNNDIAGQLYTSIYGDSILKENMLNQNNEVSLIGISPRAFSGVEFPEKLAIGNSIDLKLKFRIDSDKPVEYLFYRLPKGLLLSEVNFTEEIYDTSGNSIGTFRIFDAESPYFLIEFEDNLPLDESYEFEINTIVTLSKALLSGIQTLNFGDNQEYRVNILPPTQGIFQNFDLEAAIQSGAAVPLEMINTWYHKPELIRNYYQVVINKNNIYAENPNFVDIPLDDFHAHYFIGGQAQGLYYPEYIAVCIDIFHSLLNGGSGQYGTSMSEFVGEEGEEKIVMSLQMSMMRALQAGFYVNPASPNRYPNTVLSLMGSNDQKVDQATSLFAGQFLGWLYATKYNLDPDARLDDIISDDGLSFNESYFTPQFNLNYANNNESNRNWNSATGKNNMLDEMQEIQEMITLYDETEYMDISDPLLLKRGESKIILTIPDEQEQFIHYIDYSNSKNLDYLDGLPEDGEEFTELEVTANRDIKPGDVEIAILKTTDTFWNEDYGYTGAVGKDDQFKTVLNMPRAYMKEGNISVVTANNIQVEKRDKETGDLIEDGEATFIIQSLKSNDKWSQFSVPGAPEEFTTENGIAVIDDEKVINALHQYNGTPNDQKYRFREIGAPEGYVNPRAPIPLSANEAQGGVGDQFSVEFDMDDAIDGSLVLEMENELYLLGDVFLEKIDRFNSRNYLEGAEFSLYKINEDGDFDEVEDHDLIYEGLKTDRYGELLVEELELGDYFFLETQAPEGYSLPSYPDNRHDFTITKDSASSGELIKLEVENTPLGNVFLEKVDADNENKYLSGAIFELYKLGEDEDDEDEGELLHFGLETDRSGEIRVEGLEVGRYYFKEVEAPEGYMLPEAPDDRFYFDITEENIEEGIEVELLIPNFAEGTRGSVWLEKISSQDPNRYLSGAIFDLYEVNEDGEGQEDDRLVEAGLEVDQYGDLRVQNLPLGKYYFLETQAPDGYFLPSYPDNRFDFEITKDNLEPGVEVEVKAPNDPISARKLTLLKEDSRTGEGLQGAEFKIQEKDGDGWKTYNSVYVTDKNGKFTVDFDSDPERWTGKTFRFVEVKAPDGYLLPEGEDIYTEEFTVLANDIQDMEGNSIRQLQKLNYLDIQEYSLQLRKTDDKGQSLDGAEFTLSSDQEEQSPIVSPGQNGIFIFSPLQPDVTYTLTETKAPDGYVIDNSPYTILLRTDEEAEGKIEIHRGDQLLVEGEDYQWNSENLELVMTIENRKPNTLPFTGGMGIIGLLIGGSMAIGLAYNFQIKKKII